ncbi:hypothetical protein ASPZODRAFT_1504339 [Penicilliopsis zonata CBS 506.65]|uniref:Uncharacterized protein n=1 Tax=Penicilliopsis zonata CBS 506.65 TaxID=1073090 RepID=A0A1L9S4Q2_9EURO|nr:hypothetical protein ASPZODRAFT_1504339 [Penicilliopsis zonata CBS 506.65]OJJ42144.1 hypothetical protein ASPZODRAFT_1504339 [Penicilliopsis zonata CBS 506.65]
MTSSRCSAGESRQISAGVSIEVENQQSIFLSIITSVGRRLFCLIILKRGSFISINGVNVKQISDNTSISLKSLWQPAELQQ